MVPTLHVFLIRLGLGLGFLEVIQVSILNVLMWRYKTICMQHGGEMIWLCTRSLSFCCHCRRSEEEIFSQKKKLQNGETVSVTFCKFWTCGCDLFNYRTVKFVSYTVCMCLSRSCTQCVCEKYKRSNYHCNYSLITKGKLWLTGYYNLPLIISLDFSIYRLSYSTLFIRITVSYQRAEDMTVL